MFESRIDGTTASCTDYLDKAPESDVTPENAFKDFHNFQGFVEELYACIPDMAKQYWSNSWNWGEDEVIGVDCNYHMGYKVDQGDFWGWQAEHDGWGAGFMDCKTLNLDFTTRTTDSDGTATCGPLLGTESVNVIRD